MCELSGARGLMDMRSAHLSLESLLGKYGIARMCLGAATGAFSAFRRSSLHGGRQLGILAVW